MNLFFLVKVLVSAVVIAVASELAKKSSFVAGLTLALPLTSLLALLWVQVETGDRARLASLSWDVFWLVPPSLAFFPMFASLISRNLPFWLSLVLAAACTGLVYLAYSRLLAWFGLKI